LIAALPMYDFPHLTAAHDALWNALRDRLRALGVQAPTRLTRSLGHFEIWGDPDLLLAQACEYPLAKRFAATIRKVATPIYRAEGCTGPTYRSAIVVREDDPALGLADLRGRRCVINEIDSNSGMNLLRAAVAPLSQGGRFFASVAASGSHRQSAALVAAGAADVAALDCVSYAHLQRLDHETTAALRVLDWTPSSPSLPLITAATTDAPTLLALRASLAAVASDPDLAGVRAELLLEGFALAPASDYAAVLQLERQAAASGYSTLQ
jgi:ABC-type phosphate/phosphonate transport system substrate-binding protein